MDQEKIGRFIFECRKKKKMTQAELSERIGVTEKSVSNWENGRNMPDLSLFKPLCDIFDITINDLISGEKVDKKDYQERLEENIVNTIDYTNKRIEKDKNILSGVLILLGIFISFSGMLMFPSESSWGSHFALLGIIISTIGIGILFYKLKFYKKILMITGYVIVSLSLFFIIDYIGVVNIKQAPRFSIVKVSGENVIYYDTLFYDVVRCNVDDENEEYKIINNQKYDILSIDKYCK